MLLAVVGAIVFFATTRSDDRPATAADATSQDRDAPGSQISAGRGPVRDRGGVTRTTPPPPGSDDDAIGMTVEGRVIDGASGAPIAGVEVMFTLPGHEGPRAEVIATSAADGQYHAEISTGRWDVRAYGAGVWAPPSRLLVDPPIDAPRVRHDVLVQRAGVVRGHVIHEWADSAAVASATVSVETTDAEIRTALDETLGRSVITGADGAFELTVPPGEIKLHATTPDGAEGFVQTRVAAGGEVVVDVMIPAPARVSGTVRDSEGRPIGGASVHGFVKVLGGGADQQLKTTTDSSGGYVLANIHPGTLTLEARREPAASGPTRQALGAGQRATIDLALGKPVTLAGRVVTSAGEGAGGARVNAVLQGSRTKAPGIETRTDGSFTFELGQAGTYVVSAVSDQGAKARIVVEVGADSGSIEVVLQEPGGIRGLVTLAGGAAATAATIAVERFHREGDERAAPRSQLAKLRTLSGADGTFSLGELLPGTYDLVITSPGRADARATGVVVVEGGWADVAVTLAESPS